MPRKLYIPLMSGNTAILIAAEIGQAHDGSLGTAHAYIDAAARAGVDAVKFQTHLAAAESTALEPWRVEFSYQDTCRYDYWRRMEFTEEQWLGLRAHADERGLKFISSPFSLQAIELLERVGLSAWKIASGETGNVPLLERVASTRLPIILSSGLSPLEELDEAVRVVRKSANALTVLQCTSLYPTPPEKLGLNQLAELRQRYACPIGLSDHSGTIFAGLAAAALGSDMLEVHITFSREAFGPDVTSSITIDELHQLVQGVRFVERARNNPVDKNEVAGALSETRPLFSRSLVARESLLRGTVLDSRHLTLKKPGFGLPFARLKELLGRRLNRDMEPDEMLLEEYLD